MDPRVPRPRPARAALPPAPRVPSVPAELLAWLEAAYPEPTPAPSDALGPVMFRAGERAVVRKLRALFDRQEQEST